MEEIRSESEEHVETAEATVDPEAQDVQGVVEAAEGDETLTEAQVAMAEAEGGSVEGASAESGAEEEDKKKKVEIIVSKPLKIRDIEDVQKACEEHLMWIESVVNPRKDIKAGRANFKGNDLSGFNLAGVDLRGATFTNCICRGTIFSGANLSGANFNGADLSGADLRGAKLKRAQFEQAILIGVDWDDANTEHANFRYAKRDNDPQVDENIEQSDEEELAAAETSEEQPVEAVEADGRDESVVEEVAPVLATDALAVEPESPEQG